MEDEDGKTEAARHLFQRATAADPHHVPVWQVRYAALHSRQSDTNKTWHARAYAKHVMRHT